MTLRFYCCFLISICLSSHALAKRFSSDTKFCWRDSYTIPAGKIPTTCPKGKFLSGVLCYDEVPGYKNVAGVAWQSCPRRFTDTGAHCLKPKAYGRGAGYPWKFGDRAFSLDGARKRCRQANKQGCEKSGAIIYPKCKPGYRPIGCCVCSPICPKGMTDIGVSCQKKSRVMKPYSPGCPPGMVNDAGLCYKKCRPGYKGVAFVCWGQCPRDMPQQCGAGCSAQGECTTAILEQVGSVVNVASTIVTTAVTFGGATAALKGASTAAKVGAKQAAKAGLKAVGKKLAKKTMKKAAELGLGKVTEGGGFEAADLSDLDPTGISEVVKSYNKPTCKAP